MTIALVDMLKLLGITPNGMLGHSVGELGLGCKDIKPLLPPEIDVACHNSATSSTLSGPTEIIKKFVQKLQEKDIFARAVNVGNIAYHSRYIQPAGPILMHYLKKLLVDPKPRSSKWICSSVPENRWDTELAKFCSAEYLTNNLLSEVLFEEASKHIPNNAITIEIAPHGLLQAILRRSLPECNNISLTQRNQETAFTVAAIGK
ncbi:Fatty acid synthase [Blattella germanica]|nr:Fatty acid synthase [Blattella germanica]